MSNQIAIVVSEFNAEITDKLLEGCLAHLKECGVAEDQIVVVKVPGAIEIPLTAKWLIKNNFQVIIGLGAVIQGETDHYQYVCEQVSQGCQQVMLEYDVPVIFGVLTTKNSKQALDRVGGKHGHKGVDAADAALKMLKIKHQLRDMPHSDKSLAVVK
jgi:6,7-dimethyl-8-ribityllumazine synthase